MYYLNSRYYDQTVRRFINADVYVSTGQGILGNNMYAYCGNCPVSRIDSTGEGWSSVGKWIKDKLNNVKKTISNAIEKKIL